MSPTNEPSKHAKETKTAGPLPPQQLGDTEKTRKRRTLWIVVGAALTLIFAGGVALLLVFLLMRQESRVDAKARSFQENAEQPLPVPTLPGENDTNSFPVAKQDDLPKPAEPKLQGISFNPAQPSAVVSGKTVYVGDAVGDSLVAEITMESVTLVSTMATNVLSLSK